MSQNRSSTHLNFNYKQKVSDRHFEKQIRQKQENDLELTHQESQPKWFLILLCAIGICLATVFLSQIWLNRQQSNVQTEKIVDFYIKQYESAKGYFTVAKQTGNSNSSSAERYTIQIINYQTINDVIEYYIVLHKLSEGNITNGKYQTFNDSSGQIIQFLLFPEKLKTVEFNVQNMTYNGLYYIQDNISNLSTNESQPQQIIQQNEEQVTLKTYDSSLKIWKLNCTLNGNFVSREIPKNIPTSLLIPAQTALKMFFHPLNASMYDGNTNYKNHSSSQVTSRYSKQQIQGSIILLKEETVQIEEQETKRQISSYDLSTIFEKDKGQRYKVKGGFMKSNFTLQTKTIQSNDSVQVINKNSNLTIKSLMTLNISSYKIATKSGINNINSFFQLLKQKYGTDEIPEQEVEKWFINDREQLELLESNVRVLQESEIVQNSTQLFFKANIGGTLFQAEGVTEIRILYVADQSNRYEKTTFLEVNIIHNIKIGSNKYSLPVWNTSIEIEKLSYKLTLTKIAQILSSKKILFIETVNNTIKPYFNDTHFKEQYTPNILELIVKCGETQKQVNKAIKQLNLSRQINEINQLLNLISISLSYESRNTLIEQKNLYSQYANKISEQSEKLLKEEISKFEIQKTTINIEKQQICNIMKAKQINFSTNKTKNLQKRIQKLMSDDIRDEFIRNLVQNESIFDYISYMEQMPTNYSSLLEQTQKKHNQSYAQFQKNIVDYHLANWTNRFDSRLNEVNERRSKIQNEYMNNKYQIQNHFKQIDNKIYANMSNIRVQYLVSTTYSQTLPQLFNNIQTQANDVSNNVQYCCKKLIGSCIDSNNQRNYLYPQGQDFSNYRLSVEPQLTNMAVLVETFLQTINNLINSTNKDVPTKFQQMKKHYNYIVFADYAKVRVNTEGIVYNIHKVGGIQCGTYHYISVYKTGISYLQTQINNYIANVQKMQAIYSQFVTVFEGSVDTYQLLKTIEPIAAPALTFYDDYLINQSKHQYVRQLFENMSNLYQGQDFVRNNTMQNYILILIQEFDTNLTHMCYQYTYRVSEIIDIIRPEYKNRSDILQNDLSNNKYLSDERQWLQLKYNQMSSSFFQPFIQTDFCFSKKYFHANREQLNRDFFNISRIMNATYTKLNQLWYNKTKPAQKIYTTLERTNETFLTLHTKSGMLQFIDTTLTYASNIQQIIYYLSQDISKVKRQAEQILIISSASQMTLNDSLQILSETEFSEQYTNYYGQAFRRGAKAKDIIRNLNESVLQIYKFIDDTSDLLNETLKQYEQSTNAINDYLNKTVQMIMELNSTNVRRSEVLKLEKDVIDSKGMIEIEIFKLVEQNKSIILNKYEKIIFKKTQYRIIQQQLISVLKDLSQLNKEHKKSLIYDTTINIDNISNIMKQMKVATLNQFVSFAENITQNFNNFFSIYDRQVGQIKEYASNFTSDALSLSNYTVDLSNAKSEIELNYNTTIDHIITNNSYIQSIAKNDSKYNLIYNITQNINNIRDINVGQVINMTFDQESNLSQLIQLLNNDTDPLMKPYQTLQIIRKAINFSQFEIEYINDQINVTLQHYIVLLSGTFLYEKFLFINATQTANQRIFPSVQGINKTIEIINEQIKRINGLQNINITQNNILSDQIKDKLQEIMDIYTYLDSEQIILNHAKGVQNTLILLNSSNTLDINALNKGKTIIKSNPQYKTDVFTYSNIIEVPIVAKEERMKFIVKPFFGNIAEQIKITYTYQSLGNIIIDEHRNAHITATSNSSLETDWQYLFDTTYVQSGDYITGKLKSSQAQVQIILQGLSPISYNKALQNISELTVQNQLSIEHVLNIGYHSADRAQGTYLRYRIFQFIWCSCKACQEVLWGLWKGGCTSYQYVCGKTYSYTTNRNQFKKQSKEQQKSQNPLVYLGKYLN